MTKELIEAIKAGKYRPISNYLTWRRWDFTNYPGRKARIEEVLRKLALLNTTHITHRYTYQDWVNERIPLEPVNDYEEVLSIPLEDRVLIGDHQRKAYQKRLYDGLEYLKWYFLRDYRVNLLPDLFIDETIETTKYYIKELGDKNRRFTITANATVGVLSTGLTSAQAKWYLSVDLSEYYSGASYDQVSELWSLSEEVYEGSHYSYIVANVFVRWLQCFKRTEEANPTWLTNPDLSTIGNFKAPGDQLTSTKQQSLTPVIIAEAVDEVFNVLKDCFAVSQHNDLKELLQTGHTASGPLIFRNKGKILTEAFKNLFDHKYITGIALKRDLHNWIIEHFRYLDNNGRQQEFKPDTIHQYISTNKYPCKDPLFYIKDGKIIKCQHVEY